MKTSALDNSTLEVLLDASVVINLAASNQARAILDASPHDFAITYPVLGELMYHPITKLPLQNEIRILAEEGYIEIISLSSKEKEICATLTEAESDCIELGEASVISVALSRGGIAALDDNKAIRVAKKLGIRNQVYSVDILAQQAVTEKVGPLMQDALFMALKHARMRVPNHRLDWVKNQLTEEQLRQCSSIKSGKGK